MHTPSLVRIIVSGLVATSAVASFEVAGTGAVARRVGTFIALAGPVLAAPTVKEVTVEAREPHQYVLGYGPCIPCCFLLMPDSQGKGGKGKKGKGKKKNKRDEESALVTREPEPAPEPAPHQYGRTLSS